MKVLGDCSECCHVRVCTHEQLLYKDGVFKIYQAECRATNGLHFCYKNEPPLPTVDPVDWYLWAQFESKVKPNAIDLTQTVIVPRPIWERTEDSAETVKSQPVKSTEPSSDHTMGLKKVCKSTTEASEDWWNKMKSKGAKE